MTLPYYPFLWADYSGKTMHLTQGQHGAYFLLLRYIYTSGQPIPDEERYSIARAMLEHEQQNVDFVLPRFFEKQGETWRNLRADEVMQEAEASHLKRVNAGKSKGKNNAGAMQKQSSSNSRATKPKTKSLSNNPQTPIVDKSGSGFENGLNGKNFNIEHHLDDTARDKARSIAPGWDLYELIRIYNQGHQGAMRPDNPVGAFLGWLPKYTKGKERP